MYWLGPTCKKMMDLKSADKVFKSAAFEPTDEELREHTRSKWRRKKEKTSRHDIKMRSPSPVRSISPTSSIPDIFDDSDDDLPDVAHMLDTPPKKRKEKEKIGRNMIEVSISKFLTSQTFSILNYFLIRCLILLKMVMKSLLLINAPSAKCMKATRIWKLVKDFLLRTNVVEVGTLAHHRCPLALLKGKEKRRHLDLKVVPPMLS